LKKICPLAHFEGIKIDNGVAAYCNKEKGRLAGPVSFGTQKKNGRPLLTAKMALELTEEEKLALPMH